MKTKRATIITATIFLLTLLAAIIIPINTPAKATPSPSSEPKDVRTCKGKIYKKNSWDMETGFKQDKEYPTIVTTTNLLLNEAQIVGGTKPEKYNPNEYSPHLQEPNLTISYSPDKNYALVQGDKMYLKYVGEQALRKLNGKGKNNELPGKVTLRWKKAAIEYDTGEELDIELTIDSLNLTAVMPEKVLNDFRYGYSDNEIIILRNVIDEQGNTIRGRTYNPTLGKVNPKKDDYKRKIGTSDTYGYKMLTDEDWDRYGEYRQVRDILKEYGKGISTLFSKTEININRGGNTNSLKMDDYRCEGRDYSDNYKDGDGVEQIYKNCSIPLSSHSNQTFKFIKQDGKESNGNILVDYFSELNEGQGYKFEEYKNHWIIRKPNFEREDEGQSHVKTLDERDFVYPNLSSGGGRGLEPDFWHYKSFTSGIKKWGEEYSFWFNADWEKMDRKFRDLYFSYLWSEEVPWSLDWPNDKTRKPTEFWVTGKEKTGIANLCTGSGSKIEVGNNGYMPILYQPKGEWGFLVNFDKPELGIEKTAKIDGKIYGDKDINGNKKASFIPNNSETEFLYKVINTGKAPIYNIKVDDNRQVQVECPKKFLVPYESMTCKGKQTIHIDTK